MISRKSLEELLNGCIGGKLSHCANLDGDKEKRIYRKGPHSGNFNTDVHGGLELPLQLKYILWGLTHPGPLHLVNQFSSYFIE
jgi:hypothetical protein